MDLPTFNDLFRIARDEALVRNSQLSLDEANRKGSDLNILLAASAGVGDDVMSQLALTQSSLFLDTARRSRLDRLVFDRYGLFRKPASPSYAIVQMSTPTATAAAFSIPAGTTFATADGIQFVSTTTTNFPVGSVGPVSIEVRSSLAGQAQKAGIGTIKSVLSQLSGAPTTVNVTNNAASFGGEDEESDTALAGRARDFFLTASKGTLAAIRNTALSVPGIVSAQVFEHVDSLGRALGVVDLIVTDSFTNQFIVGGASPAYASQMAMLATMAITALDEARAAGVHVRVVVAQVKLQTVRLALSFRAGFDESAVINSVTGLVVQYINSGNPGDSISLASLRRLLQTVPGLYYTGDEIVSPQGDVVCDALQVFRTSSRYVTVI